MRYKLCFYIFGIEWLVQVQFPFKGIRFRHDFFEKIMLLLKKSSKDLKLLNWLGRSFGTDRQHTDIDGKKIICKKLFFYLINMLCNIMFFHILENDFAFVLSRLFGTCFGQR